MVTALVEDLVAISKIEGAAKKVKVEVRILHPKNADTSDDFYIIDYMHPYGISAARRIKNEKPGARIVGFYPHIRFYIKDEVEKIGCVAFTNEQFFSKIRDILRSK